MVDFKAAALRYVAIGWPVFPLAAQSKVPAIGGGSGVKEATTDVAKIEQWAQRYPRANIGLACGAPSGFVVIDIDPRNGGNSALAALAAKGRSFPPCPAARTGGGGVHLFFRFDARIANSKNKLGAGIDVKSTGGYVVGSPSFVKQKEGGGTGNYEWAVAPDSMTLPRLPIWLTTLLAPAPPPAPRDIIGSASARSDGSVRGLTDFLARAPSGERNNRLYWCAKRLAEMVHANKVSEGSAVSQLLATAMQIGLPHKEAALTIRSAFNPQSSVKE